ncbi:gamete egress and sporozoite traversal protein, putative [Plasmodium chabaudi chabaudi]|uniref:Gamete egress and sporozoite traversal protein, putative n=1 Tax=Plasmodium chabaudi chabaudi TaxID=31271 RepID=A0A077TNR2_PLACU|nr:gamete egress and sporozoite traversal protein, putative [Plasmodium chabaudi chabaudi]SCM04081.1 gamete egress and sporozoite traversal protein, putative [Plasmodium chabaudi chabaudi]SCM07289.1 gamete egress and sporozoite traversal protein, putative [Plasmodium chabaudi chabaudi]VTZ70110.1 gamete egress and sporozoite traversal protein, putative [Plasmodium chabaudi chabaudi]|eukprot:XP_736473.2 gamete egress and sporozoite traversal protein, putative [Plasmodium chabaudi chabaudi]
MRVLLCYASILFASVLQSRAIKLNNLTPTTPSYLEIGNTVSNQISEAWRSHVDSFIDVVSEKIVDKFEKDIENDNVPYNLLALLEDDAEIFDIEQYEGKDLAFIQDAFIRKLREKFNNSKFGQKAKKLGSQIKQKLTSLYKKHKDKIKHFLKIMLSSLVIPIAFNYIKKHLNAWKKKTLEATDKLNEDTKSVATPIITAIYDKFGEKIDSYVKDHHMDITKELDVLTDLQKEKKEIEKIEKQEKEIIEQ